MRERIGRALFATLLILAPLHGARAGAWTQANDRWQIISSIGVSRATKGFDDMSRATQPLKFDKIYVKSLIEYGWSDALTLFLAPEYVVADSTWANDPPVHAHDFAGEGGARVRLSDAFGIVSLQASYKFAGRFDLSDSIGHSSARVTELRLLDGFAFKLIGDDGFADLEIAQRWITHPRPSETAIDATAGLWLDADTMVLLQSFNIVSGADAGPPYTYFRAHKVELSLVETLSDRWSVQFGGFLSPAGQNSIVEQGLTAALWTRF